MKITAEAGQTLADMAVVHTGSMETLMILALKNDMPVTQRLETGQVLESADVVRREVVSSFMAASSRPATELTEEAAEDLGLGGIGYMAVEVDFIVS
ncbi:MAG: hypothetical protein II844_03715 [Prevotella sp.]|nr:hypothetical protein [Prevotella sp.]